jgi:hypothetical protein
MQDVQTWKYDSVEDTSKIHTSSGLNVASVQRVNNNSSNVTIDWKANDDYNATGFTVQRSTDGTNFSTIATVSPNTTTYTDPSLTGGVYYYRVQAFNASTMSAFSNVDSVLIGGGTNPVVINESAGFANNSGLTASGSAHFVPFATGSPNTVARLTDGGTGEGGNVFTNNRVGVAAFNTTFQFEIHDGTTPEADGFTFIIQGKSAKTLGPTGGGLGYGPDAVGGTGGIPNSIAVKFDRFSNASEGNNSTGLFVDGDSPTVPTSSRDTLVPLDMNVINLHSPDVFQVNLSYDGTTLTETITDTATNKTFTHQYAVNIPALVGSNVAYVGFGGGTGGLTATQDILSWTFNTQDLGQPKGSAQTSSTSTATPAATTTSVLVAAPSTTTTSSTTSTAGSQAPAASNDPASSTPVAAVIPQSASDTAALDSVLESYSKAPKSRKSALVRLVSL